MIRCKPSFMLAEARRVIAARPFEPYIYVAAVQTVPTYAVTVTRIPAHDIIAYAKRGVENRHKRHFGLVGYLAGLRKHFKGSLYILDDDDERDQLQREIEVCRKQNERRLELVKMELAKAEAQKGAN
jgi:hypothetical protein